MRFLLDSRTLGSKDNQPQFFSGWERPCLFSLLGCMKLPFAPRDQGAPSPDKQPATVCDYLFPAPYSLEFFRGVASVYSIAVKGTRKRNAADFWEVTHTYPRVFGGCYHATRNLFYRGTASLFLLSFKIRWWWIIIDLYKSKEMLYSWKNIFSRETHKPATSWKSLGQQEIQKCFVLFFNSRTNMGSDWQRLFLLWPHKVEYRIGFYSIKGGIKSGLESSKSRFCKNPY